SDVCSSDLGGRVARRGGATQGLPHADPRGCGRGVARDRPPRRRSEFRPSLGAAARARAARTATLLADLRGGEALGKPIGIHVGGTSGMAPTATGWCSYYVEEHHSKCEAMQALVISMVIEGVFERFPKLRVVLVEGGFVWVPSLCWRLDKHWKTLRSEVPHLKRAPSEYIREHFWYTSQPIEEPEDPRHMLDAMDWVGWDKILFSTDYPHWDFDDPKFAFARLRLTSEQHKKLFRDNAANLYGLQ